jgi:integrase
MRDIYKIAYNGAKQRCTNPKNPGYHRYGGRGIEFRFTSVDEFKLALGPKPEGAHLVDRINNNGHYEQGNLRWTTPKASANNRQNIRNQEGNVYARHGSWHVRYYVTEMRDGKLTRVLRSTRLCRVDREHTSKGSRAVRKLVRDVMDKVNGTDPGRIGEDLRISAFWQLHYLPHCEEVLKVTGRPRLRPSTLRGYRQIWKQHLEPHFGELTLREYTADLAATFLDSLTGTQVKTTLKHIHAVGSTVFKRALKEKRVAVNVWRAVEIPEDAVEPEDTKHYTQGQAEDIISALVDHVDCQLIMALACFLGMRPGEVAALRWEDFDTDWVHIRRSVVNGNVDEPKTKASIDSVPLIDQVRVPLELWRRKCGHTEGWLFESRNGTPVNLHNLAERVIIPHINGDRECVRCEVTPKPLKGVKWAGYYAGRRGAATTVIEVTGNAAVAQGLLRHKDMAITTRVYKKAISKLKLREGMEQAFQQKQLPAAKGSA